MSSSRSEPVHVASNFILHTLNSNSALIAGCGILGRIAIAVMLAPHPIAFQSSAWMTIISSE